MAQKHAPTPFLVKTHLMVDDASTDEVISWNEDGSGFVVWKPAEFSRDLLPAFFKHCNFSSFIRQLNTYGFRKVVPERWEFANHHFRRGDRSRLSEIRRRKGSSLLHHRGCGTGAPNSSKDEDQSSTSTSSPPPERRHKLAELSDENERMRRDNDRLSSEIDRSKRRYDRLLGFLLKYTELGMIDPAELARATAEAGENAENGEPGEDDDGGSRGGPRLFGVSLTKRRRCDVEEEEEDEEGGEEDEDEDEEEFLGTR